MNHNTNVQKLTQSLTFSYFVSPADAGQTLDTFLKAKGYSRHLIAQLKATPAGIQIDGKQVTTRHRLQAGQRLTTILIEETASDHVLPAPVPLDILYEDRDLLVINKGADIPIHPSQNNHGNTLANGLVYYFRQKQQPFACRIINRLDRNTTGLLLVAKHRLSAGILSRMVKEHQIHREYLALARGQLAGYGSICAPIARKPGSVIERCVDWQRGDYALTHFRTLGYDVQNNLSTVRLWLETGRTHQIRVHLQYIGHPIAGDFLYHPAYEQNRPPSPDHSAGCCVNRQNASLARSSGYCVIKRQALHSWRLSFHHPLTGKPFTFYAPVPADMARLIPAGSGWFPMKTSSP